MGRGKTRQDESIIINRGTKENQNDENGTDSDLNKQDFANEF